MNSRRLADQGLRQQMANHPNRNPAKKAIKALLKAGTTGLPLRELRCLDNRAGELQGYMHRENDFVSTGRRPVDPANVKLALGRLADQGYVFEFTGDTVSLKGYSTVPATDDLPRPTEDELKLPPQERVARFLIKAGKRGVYFSDLAYWEQQTWELSPPNVIEPLLKAIEVSGWTIERRRGSGEMLVRVIDCPEYPMARGTAIPS